MRLFLKNLHRRRKNSSWFRRLFKFSMSMKIRLLGCFVVVESSYDGPHLEDGKVTLKFLQELLERFKNQKKIHRKYAYTVDSRMLPEICCYVVAVAKPA